MRSSSVSGDFFDSLQDMNISKLASFENFKSLISNFKYIGGLPRGFFYPSLARIAE